MQKFIALKSGIYLTQGETYEGTIVDGYVAIPNVGTFYLDLFKPVKKYPYIGEFPETGKLVLFFSPMAGIVLKNGLIAGDPIGFFYRYWVEDMFTPLTAENAEAEGVNIYKMFKHLEGN